ncbi:major allergen Pru ar 1 [Jatropha curcas]|uniref:major allergen Pru ar 1 n=1 Tax=Jatropha curcas TaxID=180498 RepID=UPI0018953A8F|nr:major allergen Pru ar 1 [Jatropha curcas]
MGVVTFEGQIELPIAATKIFKMISEPEIYIPKVLPGFVKSFENLQGDGGPGTVRQFTFPEGSQYSHVKETVDVVDKENFIFQYTVIGGDPALIDTSIVEKLCCQVKFEISPDGRTICKRNSKAYTIDGVEVKEEEIRATLENATQVFFQVLKLEEAYALANPDI